MRLRPRPPRPEHERAHRGWLMAVMSASTAVFVASTLVARHRQPGRWEIRLFEAVNGLPDWVYAVVWPFMQYGVFVTIPIATLVAWWFGRHRLAVMLGVSGVGIYVLAKVVKRVADRGRPDAFLAGVHERETFAADSLGFTSGHAAVAATIATLTVLHLPRPWREISIGLVVVVMFGRMYVGAHLPLDMVGGVAMGVAAGIGATLVSGRLGRRPGGVRGRS